jgi:hypothetical protein
MDNNIFPEKIVRTTSADGSIMTSAVYTLEAWSNITIFGLIINLFLIGIFMPFVSALFLLFFCFGVKTRPIPNSHNLFGLLSSLYILIDFYKKWIFSSFIEIFFKTENIHEIQYINTGLLMVHFILLLFGQKIFDFFGN